MLSRPGLFLASGLPVARIFESAPDRGIIVHEDFGDTILRDVLATSDAATREDYLDKAIRLIALRQPVASDLRRTLA